ncbi:MAG: hypothetical protein V3U84_00785 [Thiotrichaceae bacterium]
MKSISTHAILAAGVLSLSGCATITSDGMQNISVATQNLSGTAVKGANCTLKNDKGDWKVTSPGTASVHKSSADLIVECKKSSSDDGTVRAISRAGAGMYGNIIFGGAVGALIDHSKGTAYNYSDNLVVVMGKTTVIDRRNNTKVASVDAKKSTEEK